MPEFELSPGARMFYHDDDFTDPWRKPEAVMMLHGFAESSVAWNGWLPQLARRFRVIRPDIRGFGRSAPMPIDYPWSVDGVIDDFLRLADHLGIERFHLAGAKVGAGIAMRFAADHPGRVGSLTMTGARFVAGKRPARQSGQARRDEYLKNGVEPFARATMAHRLGSACSPEMIEGWIQLMGATSRTTAAGFVAGVADIDISGDLSRLACPAFAIIVDENKAEVVEAARERMKLIADAELFVIPGDSFHVAIMHPEECAKATLAFLEAHPLTPDASPAETKR